MVKPRRKYCHATKKKVKRSHSRTNNKLDINKCSMTALKNVKVPVKAVHAIMKYRCKFKCFTHMNELLRLRHVDLDTFKLLQTLCKVENSTEELRQILHRRRHRPAGKSERTVGTCKSHTSLRRTKSDQTCHRLASSRKSSLPSISQSAASLLSSVGKSTGKHPKSVASMLSDLWRSVSNHQVSKRHSSTRPSCINRKSRSCTKLGSETGASANSRGNRHLRLKGGSVKGSSSSTARWVSDAQKRTHRKSDQGRRVHRSKSDSSRLKDKRDQRCTDRCSLRKTRSAHRCIADVTGDSKKEKCSIM